MNNPLHFKPSLEDLLKSSIRSIFKNKSRTFLTSLGVIIGVTSVILLVSIGNGLKAYVVSQFESLGSNILFVAPGQVFNRNGGFNNNGGASFLATSFTVSDWNRLKRDLKTTAGYIIPVSQSPTTIKYLKNSVDTNILGTSADYAVARNQTPAAGNGRWFTSQENDKASNVAVIGHQLKLDLFGAAPALNRKLIVGGRTMKVIGVLNKIGGGFGGPNFDSFIYIPLITSQRLTGREAIQSFQIKINSTTDLEAGKKMIETSLSKRFKDEDSFSVFDQSQIIGSINSILNILTAGLSGIAAISLLVGGIGIMNIMLVTVTERTREIGLRKAIGAYPRAILLQFLFEAIILSGIGGIIGIILGSLGTLAISPFFPARVSLNSIILAFGVSFIVGVVFGVAPARRASKLSPIEALRYE
ncbi:MAG: ABC transporter permease [Candidatus Shapirobacteria bacterium]